MRRSVRPPAVAGSFYPQEPRRLAAELKALLERARPPRGGRPIALVVPHAGFAFSGQIAADAWRQTQGHRYDLVVLLGTNHTAGFFTGISVFLGSGFSTPLGVVPVDEHAASILLAADRDCSSDPAPHEREHSIEVQLPFVQTLLPGVPILPVIISDEDPHLCARLGVALANVLAGRRALIVASSDLSHFPSYQDAVATDRAVLTAMARLDPEGLCKTIAREEGARRHGLDTCACGLAPVLAAMTTARTLGATRGTVLSHANSGDAPPRDHTRVVGYGAVLFTAGEPGTDLAALDEPAHVLHPAPRNRR
jgi:AmmeMemoRadiSam system protein B